MSFGDDQRGQSIQIGAMLLFAMLVVSMATYQVTVVPSQNAEVEFNHNQEVHGQLLEVRNGVLQTANAGGTYPVSVALGTRYPSRTVFINPPSVSGTVRTVQQGSGEILVENASAIDNETADFWTTSADRGYASRALAYEPSYNRYGSAPLTIYENSVLYHRYDGAVVRAADQRIVDGRRINLVALQGSLSRSASTEVAVDLVGQSAPTRTIAVESRVDEPLTIRVPTGLTESAWRDLLAGERGADGNVVMDCVAPDPCGTLTLTFKPGTYDLRLARVDVGDGGPAPLAAYATDVVGDGVSIPENSSQLLTVEVRDAYNGPASGVRVNATVTEGTSGGSTGSLLSLEAGIGGDSLLNLETSTSLLGLSDDTGSDAQANATTDERGLASFVYKAPENVDRQQTVEVTVEFDGGGTDVREVVFTIAIENKN